MNNDKFVLFYSNYCQHCKEFLSKLKKKDIQLFKKFNKILVDGNTNIPKSIVSVPTIITPSHNHPLTDNSVFIWLDTMADNYVENNNQLSNNDQLQSSNEGILPFVNSEMGCNFSDNFSFLDNQAGPLSHNFSFLDNNTSQENKSWNDTPNTALPFQSIDRPKIANEQQNNPFEMELDQLKNNRDCDPYIMQPPARR